MKITKKISIFGSTGSIGRSTLEVIETYKDRFEVVYLAANKNVELIIEQAKKFKPKGIIISDKEAYQKLSTYKDLDCQILPAEAMVEVVKDDDFDTLVAAMVGFSGLESTIAAIKSGKKIALANKETLVVAGHLITRLVKEHKTSLIPIDSEHSAIFQCLVGEDIKNVEQIILTASGGPFYKKDLKEFHKITVKEALNHPNWKMGNKVTIDSATLMNKGLEVIEAQWLFGIQKNKIKVLIHPQSIIHSMVEFTDGSVKAQLGMPDMKLPIQYALSYPDRLKVNFSPMDFIKYNNLTFYEPDLEKFRCLSLAYYSMNQGGLYPVAMNAANEIAVDNFLKEKIPFSEIPVMIEKALERNISSNEANLDEIIECDKETREFCRRLI